MPSLVRTLICAFCCVFCAAGLAACSESKTPVAITFTPVYGDESLTCSTGPDAQRLTDLRFYVHDVELQTHDGAWQSLSFDTETPWQNEQVALIDLEDGSGSCRGGSIQSNSTITGSALGESFHALRFTLGVPFDLNHTDPVRAQGPLHLTAMHWHWQAGYKFLRAGVRDGDAGAWVHLGSTRCRGVIGAIEGCDHPNRVTVTLPAFNPEADTVAIDLAQLFAGVVFTAPQPLGCMSDPEDRPCAPVLANLGVAGDTGASIFARQSNG